MPTAYRNARTRAHAAGSGADDEGFQAQAEQLSRRVGESAQQIWLAGLGALGRAQSEGSRLFDSLVKEGSGYQSEGRRQAEAGAEAVREEVETRFEQAREFASGGWQRLGKAFDERVRGVLHGLQIPDRAEVEGLRAEIDALRADLAAARGGGQRGARAAHARGSTRAQPVKRRAGRPADGDPPPGDAV
jgi:poly(hydroxyalkanoate) granule-associated protein